MRFVVPVIALVAAIAVAEPIESCAGGQGQYRRRWADSDMAGMGDADSMEKRDHNMVVDDTPHISYPSLAIRSANFIMLPPQAQPATAAAAKTWKVDPIQAGETDQPTVATTAAPTSTAAAASSVTKAPMVWIVGAAQAPGPAVMTSTAPASSSSSHVAHPKKGSYGKGGH